MPMYKSTITCKFNGFDLKDDFIIQKLNRNILPEKTNLTQRFGRLNIGEDFLSSQYEKKIIEVGIAIVSANFPQVRRNLARKLHSTTPVKLIFSDEPDKYYLAIIDGETELEEMYRVGFGTLRFLVPDGVAHSTSITSTTAVESSVTDDKGNTYKILRADVKNQGTAPAEPSFTIRQKAENGYVGIVSKHGAIEIGDKFEPDRVVYEQSETVVNAWANTIEETWANDVGYTTDDAFNIQNGTWRLINDRNRTWLSHSWSGDGTGGTKGKSNAWHLSRKSRTFPKTSDGKTAFKNFTVTVNEWFQTTRSDQNGLLQIVMSTEDGKWRLGWYFCKDPNAKNEVRFTRFLYYFTPENNNKKFIIEDPTYFTPDGHIGSEGGNGELITQVRMEKFGSKIAFFDYARKREYNVPEIANVEFSRITISSGTYGTIHQGVARQTVERILIQAHKVQKERDIPNRYPNNSVLRINGDTRKVTLDNLPILPDVVQIPKFFKLPPNETTTIEFYVSSWCKTLPTITVEHREGWL